MHYFRVQTSSSSSRLLRRFLRHSCNWRILIMNGIGNFTHSGKIKLLQSRSWKAGIPLTMTRLRRMMISKPPGFHQGGAAGKVRNTTLVRWVPRLVHGVPLIHQWWISYMGIPPMAMITVTIRVHWASYRNALFIISCNDSDVHKILPSRTRSTSRCFNIYIRWNPSPFSDLHWSVSKGVSQMWSVRPWNSFEE